MLDTEGERMQRFLATCLRGRWTSNVLWPRGRCHHNTESIESSVGGWPLPQWCPFWLESVGGPLLGVCCYCLTHCNICNVVFRYIVALTSVMMNIWRDGNTYMSAGIPHLWTSRCLRLNAFLILDKTYCRNINISVENDWWLLLANSIGSMNVV